jgi:hypothetical protein
MKERILTNWSIRRVLYMAMGGYLIVQSIIDKQYFGVLLGTYFAAMGLFSFGCASGNCVGNSCEIEPKVKEIQKK